MTNATVAGAFARIRKLAKQLELPDVTEGTNYGAPALKVAGKAFATVKDAETLVIRSEFEQKDLLLEMAPDMYFQTDHFKGWPGLMVRLAAISDEELSLRLAEAWRERAPKSVRAGSQQPASR
jgi:hypothetical protein